MSSEQQLCSTVWVYSLESKNSIFEHRLPGLISWIAYAFAPVLSPQAYMGIKGECLETSGKANLLQRPHSQIREWDMLNISRHESYVSESVRVQQ